MYLIVLLHMTFLLNCINACNVFSNTDIFNFSFKIMIILLFGVSYEVLKVILIIMMLLRVKLVIFQRCLSVLSTMSVGACQNYTTQFVIVYNKHNKLFYHIYKSEALVLM